MKLEILKSEVFKEVEKRSSLEAAGQPEAFEQLWASKYEGGFLDTYWIEGCASVVQLFKRYLRNDTVTHTLTTYDADEKLTISTEMPSRFCDFLEGNITTDVKMMIAANVVYRWMSVKLPDHAGKYNEEATSYADDLRLKLLYRVAPSSVMMAKTNDDSLIDIAEENEGMINREDDDVTINVGEENEGMINREDDDVTINVGEENEGMIDKGMDRLILRQYEKCDHCFEPWRDYGRCDECGPCHRT